MTKLFFFCRAIETISNINICKSDISAKVKRQKMLDACAGYVQLFILFWLYRTRVHVTQKGLCSHSKLRCIDGSPDGIAINRQSEVRFLLECKAPLAGYMRCLSLQWSWFESLFYSKQGCSSNREEASWFLFLHTLKDCLKCLICRIECG